MSTLHRLVPLVTLALLVESNVGLADNLPTIDRSTVRVFAIGSVGVEDLEVAHQTLQVAAPRAGHGTGFVVAPGLVLTAAHVVDDAHNIVVRFPESGGFFAARVAYFDKDADISVLAFEPDKEAMAMPPLALAKNRAPRVRENVFAIGYPVDATRTTPQSARGIIAGRLEDGTIQLDINLNGGNSGGPLVNQDDQVVGMVVARGAVERGIQGIGYAVQVERLAKALAEAQRRLAKGQVPPLTETAKLTADVVDEMVQYGALRQLKAAADVAGGVRTATVERALAALVKRIEDPDLLVFVAASMWNAAVAIAMADPQKLADAGITQPQALALVERLTASAAGACRKALERDSTVRERSAFVDAALGTTRESLTTGTTTEVTRDAPTQLTATARPTYITPSPRGAAYVVRGGPQARWNPETASVGLGFGAALEIRTRGRGVFGFADTGIATTKVEGNGETFQHTLLLADTGIGFGLGARHRVEVAAAVGAAVYTSKVMSTSEATTGVAFTARVGVDYRISVLRFGSGVRAFSGPTLWLEPIYLGFTF